MADHLPQAGVIKQPLNHGMQRVNAILLDGFIARDFTPGIEKLIRGKQRAHARVHAIADDAQCVVLHQLRDITGVTDSQLLVRFFNINFFADGTLKLKHHQRQTIDIQNRIRNTQLFAFNLKLVHYLVDIGGAISSGVVGDLIFRGACINRLDLTFFRQSLLGQPGIVNELNIEVFLRTIFTLQ